MGVARVAITAAGRSSKRRMTRSIDSPASSGSSPWTLTTISTCVHAPGDFGDAIGAAGGLGIGHFHVSAEGADGVEDFRVIGGDADAWGRLAREAAS